MISVVIATVPVEPAGMQLVVWRALSELSLQHREVLALRDYLALSYDEVAIALKIPIGTVMSRLHRARRQLRDLVMCRLDPRREVSRD